MTSGARPRRTAPHRPQPEESTRLSAGPQARLPSRTGKLPDSPKQWGRGKHKGEGRTAAFPAPQVHEGVKGVWLLKALGLWDPLLCCVLFSSVSRARPHRFPGEMCHLRGTVGTLAAGDPTTKGGHITGTTGVLGPPGGTRPGRCQGS